MIALAEIGCEAAWPARDPELVHETTPAERRVMPSRTLLEGCAYRPSWAMLPPARFTVPYMAHRGLQGHLRPSLEIE